MSPGEPCEHTMCFWMYGCLHLSPNDLIIFSKVLYICHKFKINLASHGPVIWFCLCGWGVVVVVVLWGLSADWVLGVLLMSRRETETNQRTDKTHLYAELHQTCFSSLLDWLFDPILWFLWKNKMVFCTGTQEGKTDETRKITFIYRTAPVLSIFFICIQSDSSSAEHLKMFTYVFLSTVLYLWIPSLWYQRWHSFK